MPKTTNLQEVTWEEVRSEVKQVNEKLAELIDKINPPARYKLIKATYSFGDLVIKNGIPHLPSPTSPGKPVPITDASIPMGIKNKLAYSVIPLFLTLKNSNEVFVDTGSRIVPLNLFNQGSLLGLFESLDFMFNRKSTPTWCVSAGARSIFVLPKITEKIGLKKLRARYNIPSNMYLKHLSDHWQMLSAITNSDRFTQPWQNEILFFTEDWLRNYKNDPNWSAFHHHLFQQGWNQAQFAIGKIELSLNWEMFAEAIASRNLKPPPYISDQIKHIMSIAAGKWPAFKPADNSQQIAPTEGLQKAIVETYLLRNYLPTIMHISLLNHHDTYPVYYSLYYPTLLEGSPNKKIASTIMLDIKDIKLLIDTAKQRGFTQNNEAVENIFKNIQFDYFHAEEDMSGEIKNSKLIIENDQRFLLLPAQFANRTFCNTSSFWRGCIRISAAA